MAFPEDDPTSPMAGMPVLQVWKITRVGKVFLGANFWAGEEL